MPELSAGFRLHGSHRNPKQGYHHRLPPPASARNSDIPTCFFVGATLSIPSSTCVPASILSQSPCCFELRGHVRPCLARPFPVGLLLLLCLSSVRLLRVRSLPMLPPRMPKMSLRLVKKKKKKTKKVPKDVQLCIAVL